MSCHGAHQLGKRRVLKKALKTMKNVENLWDFMVKMDNSILKHGEN